MSSQPLDEDGFHSIAWDDAPRNTSTAYQGMTGNSSGGTGGFDISSESDNGFETISPVSTGTGAGGPSGSGFSRSGGASTDTVRQRGMAGIAAEREHAELDGTEWGNRWMVVVVSDPVKEHEGSKDMFVSYAVRTKVSRLTS